MPHFLTMSNFSTAIPRTTSSPPTGGLGWGWCSPEPGTDSALVGLSVGCSRRPGCPLPTMAGTEAAPRGGTVLPAGLHRGLTKHKRRELRYEQHLALHSPHQAPHSTRVRVGDGFPLPAGHRHWLCQSPQCHTPSNPPAGISSTQQRTRCPKPFQTGPNTGSSAGSSGCYSDGKCCPRPSTCSAAGRTSPGTPHAPRHSAAGGETRRLQQAHRASRSQAQLGVTTQPPGFSSTTCAPSTRTTAGHGCWGWRVLGTLPTTAGEGVSSEEPQSASDAPRLRPKAGRPQRPRGATVGPG